MPIARVCLIRKRVGPHLVRSATIPPFGPQKVEHVADDALTIAAIVIEELDHADVALRIAQRGNSIAGAGRAKHTAARPQ